MRLLSTLELGRGWSSGEKAVYALDAGKQWSRAALQNDEKLPVLFARVNKYKQHCDELDRQLRALGSKLKAKPKNLVQLSSQSDKLLEEYHEGHEKQEAASEAVRDRMLSDLWKNKQSASYQAPLVKIDKAFDADQQKVIRDSIALFLRVAGGAPEAGLHLNIVPVEGDHGEGFGRSYYEDPQHTMHLATVAAPSICHELGHWFEHSIPGGEETARAYLQYRTKGDKAEALNSLYPDERYHRPEEKAKDSDFVEPYVGKEYEGPTTELTSMGIQLLVEDPTKLYQKDRGLFYFTLGMIHAARAGGFPWAKSS